MHRSAPEVTNARIASLYGVDATTLRRRVMGTQQDYTIAHRDQQLFNIGDERAIAGYVGIMADSGLPLNHELCIPDGKQEEQTPTKQKRGGVL